MLMGAGTLGPPSSDGKMYRGGAAKRQASPTGSPLQLFVRAKKRINDIYAGMDDYVTDVARFIAGEWIWGVSGGGGGAMNGKWGKWAGQEWEGSVLDCVRC